MKTNLIQMWDEARRLNICNHCDHDYKFSHYEYDYYTNATTVSHVVMICRKCGNYVRQDL